MNIRTSQGLLCTAVVLLAVTSSIVVVTGGAPAGEGCDAFDDAPARGGLA